MIRFLAFLVALLAFIALAAWQPVIAILWLVASIAVSIPLGQRLAAINSAAARRNTGRVYPGNFLPKLAGGVICQDPSPDLPFRSVAPSPVPQKRGGQAGSLNISGLPAAFSHADAEGAGAKHANDDLADGLSELALVAPSARLRFGSGFGLSLHAEQSSGERKAWLATSQSTRRLK